MKKLSVIIKKRFSLLASARKKNGGGLSGPDIITWCKWESGAKVNPAPAPPYNKGPKVNPAPAPKVYDFIRADVSFHSADCIREEKTLENTREYFNRVSTRDTIE